VTNRRRHRGRAPNDEHLFGDQALAPMREAVGDLSWLLARGYTPTSALKLVGDRYELRERQRKAVLRAACTDAERSARIASRVDIADVRGRDVALDGFNCIITIEAAMSGGAVLVGRDGAHRDMSSVHGSYRTVDETAAAVLAVGELLAAHAPASVTWFLDRPVSNSGRLRKAITDAAEEAGWNHVAELDNDPDRRLVEREDWVVATSDAWILDHCVAWVDIPGTVIAGGLDAPWIVDLRSQ
jgi:hypothetical protein